MIRALIEKNKINCLLFTT